ncbi:MAG: Txe/YoeB family addiction module toxin [Erysipelotrichaceae bacterium]|nr:Txe/YoeB family addiction module toxin [Erysipelotrichaceae bacterium]
MNYALFLSRQAEKDIRLVHEGGLGAKVKMLCEILQRNPFQNPPPYEKLRGHLEGKYSRRINIHHRLLYEVDEERKTVYILRMWTHYA